MDTSTIIFIIVMSALISILVMIAVLTYTPSGRGSTPPPPNKREEEEIPKIEGKYSVKIYCFNCHSTNTLSIDEKVTVKDHMIGKECSHCKCILDPGPMGLRL